MSTTRREFIKTVGAAIATSQNQQQSMRPQLLLSRRAWRRSRQARSER
jgi:hypothetical protein